MMGNFYITFFAVAQMLAFAAPAFLLMRFKKYDERSISVFVTLLLYVSQPCLTAYSFQKATVLVRDGIVPLGKMLERGALIFLLALFLQASFLALSYFVLRKKQEEAQYRIFAIAASFGNSGFFGVPILEAVMGQEHLVQQGIRPLCDSVEGTVDRAMPFLLPWDYALLKFGDDAVSYDLINVDVVIHLLVSSQCVRTLECLQCISQALETGNAPSHS